LRILEREVNIEAPATAEGSPDLASTCIPFNAALWASKILTEGGVPAVETLLLLSSERSEFHAKEPIKSIKEN